MNFDPTRNQLVRQVGSAEGLHDFSVSSHGQDVSTFCAHTKHKMSFDPAWRLRQLRRMAIGHRIKEARQARGVSQGKLAEQIHTGQTTISSWERGRTEPTREDVQRVAEALHLTVAELELENAPAGRTVRLVGYVGAGAAAHFYAGADDPNENVDAPEDATPQTVAAEIRGTSLGPAFDRWLVFYDDVHSPVTESLHGKLCVVGLPNDQVLVKILKPAGAPNRFHLISNGGEEPIFDQEVLWAGKVKTMRQR